MMSVEPGASGAAESGIGTSATALVPAGSPENGLAATSDLTATQDVDAFSDTEEDEEEEGMTMLEHLEELRVRLIISAVALAVGLVIAALPMPGYQSVTQFVMAVIAEPARNKLIFLKPGEGFVTYFQVALTLGGTLAMPVIVYQVMAFVLPALHAHEKKYLYMALPGVLFSFVAGITFGYMLVLPVAIDFLSTFNVENLPGLEVKWAFSEYMETVTSLLFWMGVSFQTPLVIFFLTKLRVITPQRLAGFRRYAFIGAFIIGAIITPTPDPLNQTLVSVPIYLLFELGIQISKFA
ncbi:MAG: twin-arginine translocase subunit TatC [Chloroflexota bacterium]